MKTKSLYFLCLIVLIILPISCSNNKSSNADQKIESEATEPALEVDTAFLHAYMSGNQVAADEKYKGKRFMVRGMVAEITNLYEPIVKIETEVGPVECVFDKTQTSELAKLSIAQNVVIDCTFQGIIMSVRFNKCTIVEGGN